MTIVSPEDDRDARRVDPSHISIEARISDLVRIGIIAVFAYWSAKLIAPFLLIGVWAAILTVALYPIFDFLSRLLGGRILPAAIILVSACLLVIIGPLALAASDLVHTLQSVFANASSFGIPQAPQQLQNLPLVGPSLSSAWNAAAGNVTAAIMSFQAPLREAGGAVLSRVLSIGGGILSFIASVFLCGLFLTMAPRLSSGIQTLAGRIAGNRGVGFARLAGKTVNNVSRGVIGVALLQTLLCGFVFVVFGVPARGALIYGVFFLCLIQIGPGLILAPLIIWTWFAWPFGTSLLFTVVTFPVMLIDNILKPILISRGLSTPMPVILIGVLGGTISHGLIGLFIGPIVLGVFYDLVAAWAWAPSDIRPDVAPQTAGSDENLEEIGTDAAG